MDNVPHHQLGGCTIECFADLEKNSNWEAPWIYWPQKGIMELNSASDVFPLINTHTSSYVSWPFQNIHNNLVIYFRMLHYSFYQPRASLCENKGIICLHNSEASLWAFRGHWQQCWGSEIIFPSCQHFRGMVPFILRYLNSLKSAKSSFTDLSSLLGYRTSLFCF